MKLVVSNHQGADKRVPPALLKAARRHLEDLDVEFGTMPSREIRAVIKDRLLLEGWSKPVRIEVGMGITVTAMNGPVALCLQFGNMSRFYADLLKLQHMFKKGKAEAAIYILPTQDAARAIGSNIACKERLERELAVFKDIITIPIVVLGVEGGTK